MKSRHEARVDHYYDRNTQRFLRCGLRGSSATIHRAVWAPGVTTRREAVHHVHELILRHAIDNRRPPIVWDLGCGVGASIAYLAARKRASYRGVTISRTQRALAQRLLSRNTALPADDWAVLVGDFCKPETLGRLKASAAGSPSLIYMIEAFGHATDPRTLLAGAADALCPGGRLVICDDIISGGQYRAHPQVRTFAAGWRISTLWTVDEISRCAASHGLELQQSIDLTPWVELNRPRDRLIRLVIDALDRSGLSGCRFASLPFWGNMRGGNALQQALATGAIGYRFLVYRKQ
ncbi:MAG: methyltransferase domain-containing protein [Spirochaetaceae bacterium]|nr:MAG: methyltransferase domain-containing protein [Spirochaetaceae bacterium]